jgi:hypothetical protein
MSDCLLREILTWCLCGVVWLKVLIKCLIVYCMRFLHDVFVVLWLKVLTKCLIVYCVRFSHDVFVVLWLKVLNKCLIVYCMSVWMYISIVSFLVCITQDAQGHLGFYIMRLGECKFMNFPLLKWLKLCATSARIFLITFRWYYWSFLTSTSETGVVSVSSDYQDAMAELTSYFAIWEL